MLACAALAFQWIAFTYLLPRLRKRRSRQALEAQVVARARAEQARRDARAEERAQIGPAPRVRAVAWVGTDVSRASTALGSAHPPPLHPNPRRVAKVAPASPIYAAEPAPEFEEVGEPWTMGHVLCAPFTIAQTLLGAGLGFIITFAFFTLIFHAGGPYAIDDPSTLVALILSPLLTTVLSPMAMPIAMPEAISYGWLGYVPHEWLPPSLACLPFLRVRPKPSPKRQPQATRASRARLTLTPPLRRLAKLTPRLSPPLALPTGEAGHRPPPAPGRVRCGTTLYIDRLPRPLSADAAL